MRNILIIITFLISSASHSYSSQHAFIDDISKNLLRDYEKNASKITKTFDYSKKEKVKNLLDSGFKVAGKKMVLRFHTLLPSKLHHFIDGDVYCKIDPDFATHFICFMKKPGRWLSSFSTLDSEADGWVTSGNTDLTIGKPFILINFSNAIAVTITFWENSPPTCSVVVIDI